VFVVLVEDYLQDLKENHNNSWYSHGNVCGIFHVLEFLCGVYLGMIKYFLHVRRCRNYMTITGYTAHKNSSNWKMPHALPM
jgi:hypothetical protein